VYQYQLQFEYQTLNTYFAHLIYRNHHVRKPCALGENFIRRLSLHNGLGIVASHLGAVRVAVSLEPKHWAWILVIVAAQFFVPLVGAWQQHILDLRGKLSLCEHPSGTSFPKL
jgi:hypothetical protein